MRPLVVVPICALSVALALPLRAQDIPRQVSSRDTAATPANVPPRRDSVEVTPAAIAAGRRIFHSQGGCAACHGPALEGTAIAPTLRTHAWRDAKSGDLDAIYYVVTHGVAGTVMVSHPGAISDQMARQVAAYIWSVNHRGEKP